MARIIVDGGSVRRAIVLALAAITGTWGLFEAWHRAPVEMELKLSQKIFYFHAPIGMWCIALSIVASVSAAFYLWKRREAADLLCESCMEVVLVTCGISLVTGMLWAKPAWGDWFPWGEPRVTGMLILFLVALAYLVLRSSVDEPGKRARFSCVLAIVGGADAIMAYMAIHLWNTTHPRVITGGEVRLAPDMKRAFYICIVAMGLLAWSLAETRFRHARLRAALDDVKNRTREMTEEAS